MVINKIIIGDLMNILILNVGSSSVKYSVYEVINSSAPQEKKKSKAQPVFKKIHGGLFERVLIDSDRTAAVSTIKRTLSDMNLSVDLIGHRVVHGCDLVAPMLVDNSLITFLKGISDLAPLHELPEIDVIEECRSAFPTTKQFVVFDTSFHASMPEKARVYGLPYSFYESGIKRYGFHGSSHKFVSAKAIALLCTRSKKFKRHSRIITCHLGNGCSIAAIKDGKSIDTSMGFTPLEGLVMGTRSGTIDPGMVSYLSNLGHDVSEISNILNNQSGLLGISGVSSDMRDLVSIMKKNSRARLAVDVFCYNAKKFIGSYAAVLDGVDAVVFTGGIGENSAIIRRMVLENLDYLGIHLDSKKNLKNSVLISSPHSRVKLFVIRTDEEELIASESYDCFRKL